MELGCMYGAFGVKCDFNAILPTVLVYSSLVIVYKNFSSFNVLEHSFIYGTRFEQNLTVDKFRGGKFKNSIFYHGVKLNNSLQ